MIDDPELQAMADVQAALEDLEEEEVRRVLRWVAERHKVDLEIAGRRESSSDESDDESESESQDYYDTFADFFHAAGPETEADKVLLAGYWFQTREGKDELTSRILNDKLKQLGHQVSNITREVRRLMKKKPALVVQLRKKGSSRQAHKVYKLSHAGVKRVEEMLAEE